MAWTLWRGDTLLGKIRAESLVSALSNSRPTRFLEYTSFLLPVSGAELHGLSQVRLPVLGDDRFYQHSTPLVVSNRDEDSLPPVSRPFAILEPMDPAAAAGAPLSQQLRLLGEDGVQLSPRFIHLHEARYEPEIFAFLQAGIPGEPVDPIPADAYVNGSVWHFSAAFDSPAT